MATQTKTWLGARLPLQSAAANPVLAREAPYLAILPALLAATLVFLTASGFVLSVYYAAAHGGGYDSIQLVDRSVNFGWLIQSFHTTGTTMIFATVYLLLFRGLLTQGWRAPGELLWFITLAQFLLLLLVGYLGYLMADGALSFWSLHQAALGAAGLAGLPGAVGSWFFGGIAGPGTLLRLAAFHTVLALAIFGLVALHYVAKRALPVAAAVRPVRFHPYYTSQYFVAFVVYALIFAILVFFAPHLGQSRLNALPADPLVVPVVLTPPWYLLPVSALAGFLPGSGGAIIGFAIAIGLLVALPWLDRSAPGQTARFGYRFFTWVLGLDVIALAVAADAGPSVVTEILSFLFVAYYVLHFLVLVPLTTAMESR